MTIEFEITETNSGEIRFAIYDSKENHMEKEFRTATSSVENNTAKINLENMPKGTYSFSYYHDVNNNNELDKNMMGIPKEPYGFSNGEKGRFGPPSFEESKIVITKDTTLQIKIK